MSTPYFVAFLQPKTVNKTKVVNKNNFFVIKANTSRVSDNFLLSGVPEKELFVCLIIVSIKQTAVLTAVFNA